MLLSKLQFFYMFTFPIVTHLLNLVFSIAAPMYLVHQSVMVCLGLYSVIITLRYILPDWEWQLQRGKQFMCVFEYLLLELWCLLQYSLLFFFVMILGCKSEKCFGICYSQVFPGKWICMGFQSHHYCFRLRRSRWTILCDYFGEHCGLKVNLLCFGSKIAVPLNCWNNTATLNLDY